MVGARTRIWSSLGLVGSLAVLAACTGPISDLPKAGSGNKPPSLGAGRPGGIADGGVSSPPITDTGSTPPVIPGEDSVVVPPTSGPWSDAGSNGAPDWGSDAGLVWDGGLGGGFYGSLEAGVPDAGDAGVSAPDAGDASLPTHSCQGSLALLTADQLILSAPPFAACNHTVALAAACNGTLAQATNVCTERNALMFPFRDAVESCLRAESTTRDIPRECLRCYADEVACAVAACLVPCIDGTAQACQECRTSSCSAAFKSCSGLPAR